MKEILAAIETGEEEFYKPASVYKEEAKVEEVAKAEEAAPVVAVSDGPAGTFVTDDLAAADVEMGGGFRNKVKKAIKKMKYRLKKLKI